MESDNILNIVKQSEGLIKVEKTAGKSKIMGSQHLGLSHLTDRKSVLN